VRRHVFRIRRQDTFEASSCLVPASLAKLQPRQEMGSGDIPWKVAQDQIHQPERQPVVAIGKGDFGQLPNAEKDGHPLTPIQQPSPPGGRYNSTRAGYLLQ